MVKILALRPAAWPAPCVGTERTLRACRALAGGAVPLEPTFTTEPRFRTIGRAGPRERHFSGWRVSPHETRESVTDEQRKPMHWQSIDTAPADRDILIYVAAWPVIAPLNSEFGEWTSRMQCPVSLAEGGGSPDPLLDCSLPEPPTAPAPPADLAEHGSAPPSPAPARRRESRGAENPAISLRQHEARPPRRRLGSDDEDLEQNADVPRPWCSPPRSP